MLEKYWTTHQNHEFKKCNIILAFRGSLTFNDTRPKQVAIPKPLPALVRDKHAYGLYSRDKGNSRAPPSRYKISPPRNPQGKVVIRTHGLPKNQAQVHVLKCHLYKDTSDTEKKLCSHYEKVHKGFSFHCQYCNKNVEVGTIYIGMNTHTRFLNISVICVIKVFSIQVDFELT